MLEPDMPTTTTRTMNAPFLHADDDTLDLEPLVSHHVPLSRSFDALK